MTDSPTTNSQQSEPQADARLARILLPAAILREVDELVLAGRGGFRTRQEFFAEAIQNLILETKHGVGPDGQLALAPDIGQGQTGNGGAPPEPATPTRPSASAAPAESGPQSSATSEPPSVTPITDIAATALPEVTAGPAVENGIGAPKREPVIGLHNRDYPSLWVGVRLAQMTKDGPVLLQDFVNAVTEEAWEFAAALLPLEKLEKVKLTALLPTNRAKPQSAEASFRSFAIGEIARRPNDDGTVNVAEGLFAWEAAQLTREDGQLRLGLTGNGYDLLRRMNGLTLAWPHDRAHAESFIDYIRTIAPWDWEGFAKLLDAGGHRPNRAALTLSFNQWHPEWSETLANTNAAGYVARAREWGLLEPKLVDGRYVLTDFGQEIRREA